MRQLKYIEDECFFKEIQALKEFKIRHYCDCYDIASFVDDSSIIDIDEVTNFLDSFDLPDTVSVVYTNDYVFVFDACSNSDLFKTIVTSIKKGIKMNDDNNPLKLKELQELNEELMKQLDQYKKYSKTLEEVHLEHCTIQVSNPSKDNSSNISIDPLHLFNW